MGFWADTGPLGCRLALFSHPSMREVLLATQTLPSPGPWFCWQAGLHSSAPPRHPDSSTRGPPRSTSGSHGPRLTLLPA